MFEKENSHIFNIKILGSGCANCKRLEATARKVAKDLKLEAEFEKVTGMAEIMTGVVPIISALMDKGDSLGTVLAFMMSVVGLSLPETIILRRVLKLQLIAIFVGVVALAIIITGYLFNLVM